MGRCPQGYRTGAAATGVIAGTGPEWAHTWIGGLVRIAVTAVVAAGTLGVASPLSAQRHDTDTLAPAVVQRFVDAANARDIPAMMVTVAPEAVFSVLPSGEILGAGQDSIRGFYEAIFARLAPGFSIEIARRIHDGGFVVDHEVFRNAKGRAPIGRATWVYWVTGGLSRRAWTLKPTPAAP